MILTWSDRYCFVEQNTYFAGHLEIYHMSSRHRNYFASMTGVLTRPWRSPKPAQQVSVCLGQIVILATCSSDKPRVPALAKMSSFSLTLLHLDRWQLFKCDAISSMHSETNTFLSTPLLGPHSVYSISQKEQLDETAEWAILLNWSDLRRFQWHDYIWNWHLLHFNSIRLKPYQPKQDRRGNSEDIP